MNDHSLEQPYEIQAIRDLQPHFVIAAHAALEQALEQTPRAAHEKLASRYASTLGHNLNLCFHNALETRVGGAVQWHNDRNFIALVPRGLDVAMRLGRCDSVGHPNDSKEREEGTPFERFMQGQRLMFEKSKLIPLFVGYSFRWASKNRRDRPEIDQVVVAKFVKKKHEWSWALNPAEPGRIRSVLDGKERDLKIIPTWIPIERQRGIGS